MGRRSFVDEFKKTSNYIKDQISSALSKVSKLFRNLSRKELITLGIVAVLLTAAFGLHKYIEKYNLSYSLTPQARSLLPEAEPLYESLFEEDRENNSLSYNKGYKPGSEIATTNAYSKFSANFYKDPEKGIEVVDAVNKVSMTIKPLFELKRPEQKDNRILYQLRGEKAMKVVSMSAIGYKEDIILEEFIKKDMVFEYELNLPEGVEARIENDGSLGVYGAEPFLLGDVSTGSAEDKELLDSARENSEKNLLLFQSPAPFIKESGKEKSSAKTWYSLEDNILRVHTANLNDATYPISVDPSIYVDTARRLMRGNNETNIDFNVPNELIRKGSTTGARFDNWTNTMALPEARWNHATAVVGGHMYVSGGSNGTTSQSSLYWATLNDTTGALESPNPGDGVCGNWCTNSSYDLPQALTGHSMVAYNGFLYVLGGVDSTGSRVNTVYIARLGANGEPSLWHPTDSNENNWDYWFSSTNTLSTERSYSAAAVYNNRLYLFGGQTDASSGGVNTVEYADILPTGDISSWSSTDMVSLPSVRHSHSVEIYNDTVYLVGGNSSGTLQDSVDYIKLGSDGSMLENWNSTTGFSTARMTWGGNFSTVWGGYLYLAGGCTAVNASGYCTSIADDIQLVSINADGTLAQWSTVLDVTSQRMGFGFTVWRNKIYGIGGCTAQDTTSGDCTSTNTLTQYGDINPDGDASTISNSVDIGTGTCSGSDPYRCDLPPPGSGNGEGGNMSGGTVINNGYVYYIGGCREVGGSNICYTGNQGRAVDNIYYASIAADGTLRRPAVCTGTNIQYAGNWCVDNNNTVNSGSGIAGFGVTIYNNVIYVVGGTDGSTWQSNIWYTSLNSDGSLNPWNTQTFTNIGLGGARGYSYVFTRANPSTAGTFPANLYIIGGCAADPITTDGVDCSGTQYSDVYKCKISTSGALGTGSDACTTSGQVQIDSEPNTAGTQGLGGMAGTVYANYIYLIGGQSPNESERGQVMYAKIDDNNNIVDIDGETAIDNIWETSPYEMNPPRRRNTAFGYNGYLYALAGYAQGTELNDLLFAKIDVSDGSISQFRTSLVTVNQRWDIRGIINNGFVYTLGGCGAGEPPSTCNDMDDTVQVFQLYNNWSGSPAEYSASSNLFSTDRMGASAAVLNGYIYIAGGCTSASDCTTATDNVQFAPLDSTGTIGSWSNTTDSTLPAARVWGQLEAAGDTLYYIGGQSSTSSDERSEVYYGTPSSSTGDISSWNTASNGLPAARTKHSATSWNNRLYVTGGLDGSGSETNTVYVSPQLSNGGDITSSWSSSTGFEVARSGHTTVAYANNLYVFGGYDGANYLSDSQFTQINSDGTVDDWNYTTSLPTTLRQADGFASNGFLYLFGGRTDDTSCESNTIVTPISANTTIATGNNPTGVGEWYETNVRYDGNRYGASAVYHDGKAYLLGGACGSTLSYTGANRIVQSTLQSQPQVAKYSLRIDTDSDVFPTNWLINGVDNDIGARWKLKYQSSTDANNNWGNIVNFGEVTLGSVENFTPLDDSGTNTEFARFYYFNIEIDSSQAYGYPDDVTRGPTINDITLFFTSDPSKRLRHGKTFTGGLKQPLDTPPGQ